MSNCRTMRRLCAPTAARTANSCCRAVPCASSRIDTLPHPIASSRPTAPNSRYSVPLISLSTHSLSPSTCTLKCSGKCFGISLANWSSSGCSAASAAWCFHARPQPEIDDTKVCRILRHLQRQIDIRVVPPKPRRRHAHDGVVLPVELQRLPDHLRVSAKVLLPEHIGHHRHGLRILPVDRIRSQQIPAPAAAVRPDRRSRSRSGR